MSDQTRPIPFEDISQAFEFVASSSPGGNDAILCRRTGKIYWRREDSGLDELDEELPTTSMTKRSTSRSLTNMSWILASRWCWICPRMSAGRHQ